MSTGRRWTLGWRTRDKLATAPSANHRDAPHTEQAWPRFFAQMFGLTPAVPEVGARERGIFGAMLRNRERTIAEEIRGYQSQALETSATWPSMLREAFLESLAVLGDYGERAARVAGFEAAVKHAQHAHALFETYGRIDFGEGGVSFIVDDQTGLLQQVDKRGTKTDLEELAANWIRQRTPVAHMKSFILDLRAKADDRIEINHHLPPAARSRATVDRTRGVYASRARDVEASQHR